jgi:hypothetical protein
MVEDGLMERASENNPRGVRKLTRRYRVTRVLSGEMGNLVVKANTEMLEAWVRLGKVNSISAKANQVTRVSQTCLSYPKLFGSNQGCLKVTPA